MKEKMLFLLFWTIVLSGLWCQASTSVSVPEGRRAALACPLHTDNCTGPVSWYKQIPGEGPQLVLSYFPNNTSQVMYGQGFNSSRFTVLAKDNETYQHQLVIISTTKHDTAVYYCGLKQLNKYCKVLT